MSFALTRHVVQCSSIAPCLARGKQFSGLIDAKCPFVRRLVLTAVPGYPSRDPIGYEYYSTSYTYY